MKEIANGIRMKRFYNSKRYEKRRDLLNDIKLKSGCIDCGYKAHPSALHFDHLQSKRIQRGFGQNVSLNWDFIMQEVSRCVVRCANCHAIRHARDRKEAKLTIFSSQPPLSNAV